MCECGAEEVVEHLLVTYREFERDWLVLADDVNRIVGAGGIWKCVHGGKVVLLLEKVWRE